MIVLLLLACHHTVNLDPSAGAAPTAEQLFEANVRASGGARALSAHENLRTEGSFVLAGGVMRGRISSVAVAPNQIEVTMDLGPLGKAFMGYDGTVGWSVDQMTGPRLLSGRELEFMAETADFSGPAHWRDRFLDPKVEGTVQLDGATVWKVSAKDARGGPLTTYHRVSDGLIVGMDHLTVTAGGDVPAQARFSDFRTVGGVLVAHQLVEVMGPMRLETRLEKVEYDVPGLAVTMPPDVAELLKESR